MPIPTEPIGSLPRAKDLTGTAAVKAVIAKLEALGSPVVTDGEQTKPSFVTYPMAGLSLAPEGVTIPFADGHTRRLPVLKGGPFRYGVYADSYLTEAKKHAKVPVKQAVIAVSAMSLLYPEKGLPGYSRDAFLSDLVSEGEKDIRRCLDAGAHCVQVDFTEGRLSLKLDPSGGVLKQFVALNNLVLERFTERERARIGVHTCPGGDHDSTHSADVDYAGFLPEYFKLKAGNFYLELSGEKDRARVLKLVAEHLGNGRRAFVGVTDPISKRVETPEEVRDQVLAAAAALGPERLGTTDDCGFSPFADDASTPQETAFAKIKARLEGTALAAAQLGV